MIDDIKINQFPYLGVSKNLMEFFVVIGYDERMIKESQSILEKSKKYSFNNNIKCYIGSRI